MAICLVLPVPQLPSLPPGISISLAIPFALPDITFCCKLPPLPISIPPIPIGSLILNPGLIATLNGYITAANAYLNSMPLSCPLE